MSDPSQLPHLLDLIDDDSEVVRRSVMEALAVFGPSLREALAGMEDPPDETERRRVLALVDAYGNQPHRDDGSSDPRFEVGQLVCHVRYDYRGVIVDLDTACEADADWYLRNTTQPDRDQPWYHVLVHGSSGVTYAAQTSLTEDPSAEEVVHPFITLFFTELSRGRYIRNDRPWPDDH
jgi:heat shock protein HspQ